MLPKGDKGKGKATELPPPTDASGPPGGSNNVMARLEDFRSAVPVTPVDTDPRGVKRTTSDRSPTEAGPPASRAHWTEAALPEGYPMIRETMRQRAAADESEGTGLYSPEAKAKAQEEWQKQALAKIEASRGPEAAKAQAEKFRRTNEYRTRTEKRIGKIPVDTQASNTAANAAAGGRSYAWMTQGSSGSSHQESSSQPPKKKKK